MAFLDLVDVRKEFGSAVAVKGFDLRVERGELVSFLGPSGCGKTTTLRLVAGFEQPSAGTITLDGVDITRRPANRRNIGMVFQSYALFPNMTVAENIGFGLRLKSRAAPDIKRRVQELLELIQLPDRGASYPYQLSGGQQQRVALAIEPQVLLLDEPLSALDAKIRIALRAEIRAIQRKLGMTTIYVTHDQEEALSLSDRIVVMNEGAIEQIGSPFQIYNAPQTAFVAAFVGTLNVLPATVLDPERGRVAVDGQEVIVGRSLGPRRVHESIVLALRPEVIGLDEPDRALNRMSGVVEDVSFLGGIVRVWLRMSAQRLVFDLLNHPHLVLPQRGQSLTVSFPAEACLVLDGSLPVGIGSSTRMAESTGG